MAANGRGSMRAQSRSPPFLVIGLLVALVILGANYWNLSSSNSKLSFEVAELQDQVRQISAKRISAEKKIDSMAESYNRNKETLAQKESDVKSLNSQIGDKVEELQSLGKERESCQNNLKNCEENSNGIQQELQKVKEEVEQLRKKEQEVESNTPNCDSVCADMRKMIIGAVEKTMGINAVQTLHLAGVDVGEYKDKFGGSRSQNQAEQPQNPVGGEVKDAQMPVQTQGGEKSENSVNNQPGQVVADPKQPAETNALPQGQVNPKVDVLPVAQGQAQSNPNLKPQNSDQAAANPVQNANLPDKQNEANIIPPGQSNPDIPNPQVNHQVPPPDNQPQEQGQQQVPGNPDNNPDADADDQVQQPGQVGANVTKSIPNIADTLHKNVLNPIISNTSLSGLGDFGKSLSLKAAEIAKQHLQGNLDQLKKRIIGKTLDQVNPKVSDQDQSDRKTEGQGQGDKKTLGQGQANLDPREAGKEEVSAEVKPAEVKPVETIDKVVEINKAKLTTKSKGIPQSMANQQKKDKDNYDDDYDGEDEKRMGQKGDGKVLEDNYDDDTDGGDEKLKFVPGKGKADDVKTADDSIDTLKKKMQFQDQQK
ncbi:Golgi membrane protein 1-like [Ylistrum balloti]|uniref:Golgi membrane protein 1-like n=1 Tax=Ylistrum balloti TaxID=509963 RepID=UPI0029057DA8|nr:Golgi membrane protein 1-like [Ylistrum balloti]